MQNISKYIAINDFLLLEYEFNRDGTTTSMSSMGASVITTIAGNKQFINNDKISALGVTNNILELCSVPADSLRNNWFNNNLDRTKYGAYINSSTNITDTTYAYDTVKVHIVSGYNFDDVAGFLLQVRAEDSSGGMVDLSNFSYIKQIDALGSADVIKFSSNTLYLGNKFYDKYVEFKIPSVYALSGSSSSSLESTLLIKSLSDVFLTYSTIGTIQTDVYNNNTYLLADSADMQLPVTSVADNFNIFIAESEYGDFIEYYATWNGEIIGSYIGDIESGRIKLYTSDNPNDNYESFTDTYGSSSPKWTVMHEIFVYEQLPGITAGSSILTQKFAFTQDNNFSSPNYFRPVLKNADLDVSYTIQYICRLSNRMDGTQIIRRASFASTDPKKYGLKFNRINVDNLIPYKIFNRVEGEKANVVQGSNIPQNKYVKVFYDVSNIILNENNSAYPDGVGPLFLKGGDSNYKFKFEKINSKNAQRQNIDLSGVFAYSLTFSLDNGSKIEIAPTYSNNMNTVIGEIEFKITGDQSHTLLQQKKKKYTIMVKNPDKTTYVLYEGPYYDNMNFNDIMNKYKPFLSSDVLSSKVASLESQIKTLNQQLIAATK
jgi:hypothetical protein